MPEMDGVETLKQSATLQNNLSKDAIMIILTANAVSGAKEMFIKEGFQDYLSKPLDISKLEKMLLKYLPQELIDRGVSVNNHSADTCKSIESDKIKTNHVDWELGRKRYMDDEEFYREILNMMIESEADVELEQYFEASDYENYRIKVHAVKTNLAGIGAMGASDMAKQLELAIKTDNDVAYVQEHHAEFIVILRQVFEEIKEYLSVTGS